jgi:hypothetical protein
LFSSKVDFKLIRNAIFEVGIQHLEKRIIEGLRRADARPLVALLLTYLPNLTTLYIQLLETDIFLAEVLKMSLKGQRNKSQSQHPTLQNLREVYNTSAWNYQEDEDDRQNYMIGLGYTWPIWQLPSIRKLSVVDFSPSEASLFFPDKAESSNITDLTLVHHNDSLVMALDVMVVLTLPKSRQGFQSILMIALIFRERKPNSSPMSTCGSVYNHIKHLSSIWTYIGAGLKSLTMPIIPQSPI